MVSVISIALQINKISLKKLFSVAVSTNVILKYVFNITLDKFMAICFVKEMWVFDQESCFFRELSDRKNKQV